MVLDRPLRESILPALLMLAGNGNKVLAGAGRDDLSGYARVRVRVRVHVCVSMCVCVCACMSTCMCHVLVCI